MLALGPGFHLGANSCSRRSFCLPLFCYKTLTCVAQQVMIANMRSSLKGACRLWHSTLKENEHTNPFGSLSPIR